MIHDNMEIEFQEYKLRSFQDEDAASISKYANDRKIWLNLRNGFPHPFTMEDARKFVSNACAKQPETFFAVASNDEVIGSIGFAIGQDTHRLTAELGYWLAEPYWNRGITTGAIQNAVEFLFETLKLVRIVAKP